MLGILLGAAVLGVIITVMEEGDFPGWFPMIMCVLAASCLLASLAMAGCGGDDDPDPAADDTPAVCSSVDALQKSIDDVRSTDLDRNTLPTLETSLTKVKSDLGQVKTDAEDEYAVSL